MALPNALQVLQRLEAEDPPPDRELPFEWVEWNGAPRAIPRDGMRFLYRGQNGRWHPCVPSVLRQAPGADAEPDEQERFRLQYILSRVRIAELEALLEPHPVVKAFLGKGVRPSYDALAQHYEIPTDYLDLTSCPSVAAFFAVARCRSGSWEPCSDGVGVFYRVRWHDVPSPTRVFDCIGLQPFARPGRQHGWVARVRRNVDFESLPFVESLDFKHDRSVSEQVMSRWSGGADLYPSDSIATIATRLSHVPVVTEAGIRSALKRDGAPNDEWDARTEALAIAFAHHLGREVIRGHAFALTDEDLQAGEAEARQLEAFMVKGVGLRLVRQRR
jgi:hypothetical protein